MTIVGRLRVHLFVVFDLQTQHECFEKQLFGDQHNRGKLGGPRDLSEILPGDFAILWRKGHEVHGVWRIVEARERIDENAWGGRLPTQVRVSLISGVKREKQIAEIGPLLTNRIGRKQDYYDGAAAQAILKAFSVPTAFGDSNTIDVVAAAQSSKYRPPFFDEMLKTSEWWGFEDYTHALLRMLGIHNLHPIPRDNQAGRPDGVFTIGSLAVIYDATLNSKSETYKQQQIRNYINELKRGELNVPPNHTEPIANCTKKRVWLLVRGRSGLAKTEGSIKVCYVDVQHLMALSEKRLVRSLSLEDLEDELARIGTE